jgi:hypothetical protein
MRDIDAFYVIKHENGDDFSVMFTNEEFKIHTKFHIVNNNYYHGQLELIE